MTKNDTRVYNIFDRRVDYKETKMVTKGKRTREYILDRAYGLFAEKGFKQVTMKDVCETTGLSRGGLYSHFPGTAEIFEALLEKLGENDAMDFQSEIEKGVPAKEILENALTQMKKEMLHPEDSLSVAIYEYAQTVDHDLIGQVTAKAEKKWSELIEYGISRGEFRKTDVKEMVDVILYSYQGVRMWSGIIHMKPETAEHITDHIRKELVGG